ncbi:hypothetical protein IAR55_001397 [Kwoniella newhampshirensis]|uniref:Uncharacterized protein n=1 Tax=Kwoniella newhampshirensis TaxID=1651941 RepID=A0AAW0Z204_9TREE
MLSICPSAHESVSTFSNPSPTAMDRDSGRASTSMSTSTSTSPISVFSSFTTFTTVTSHPSVPGKEDDNNSEKTHRVGRKQPPLTNFARGEEIVHALPMMRFTYLHSQRRLWDGNARPRKEEERVGQLAYYPCVSQNDDNWSRGLAFDKNNDNDSNSNSKHHIDNKNDNEADPVQGASDSDFDSDSGSESSSWNSIIPSDTFNQRICMYDYLAQFDTRKKERMELRWGSGVLARKGAGVWIKKRVEKVEDWLRNQNCSDSAEPVPQQIRRESTRTPSRFAIPHPWYTTLSPGEIRLPRIVDHAHSRAVFIKPKSTKLLRETLRQQLAEIEFNDLARSYH